jgi:hypothetical protein
MRTHSLVISATLIAALVLGPAVIALAADPFVGSWKMNPAKSKSDLKSFTMTTEAQGNSFKSVQDLVDPEGKVTHRSWTIKYDGKDYPITGDPTVDTISVTKPNANTLKYAFKKNGKEVDRGEAVISKDGKTVTDVGSGKDAKGQDFNYTNIMEKQ